jgi:hypothetical protein
MAMRELHDGTVICSFPSPASGAYCHRAPLRVATMPGGSREPTWGSKHDGLEDNAVWALVRDVVDASGPQ